MPASARLFASRSRPNCGKRRDHGMERTSTSRSTPPAFSRLDEALDRMVGMADGLDRFHDRASHQVDEAQRRGGALVAAAGEVERHLDRRPPGERPVGYPFQRQAAQRRRHDGDAEARRHEVEGRDDARRLLADMRAEARLGAGRDDDVVEAAPVGPAVEDEVLVGEILERELLQAGQPMARRGRQRPCPPAAAHGR